MKKRTINMKKSLAIAVAASNDARYLPDSTHRSMQQIQITNTFMQVWTGQSTGRMKMFIWQAEVH